MARLPFYYGWVVVAVAFVTMGIGVNIRTSFSLLFPPILDEFGWSRGETAGAFSVGFLVSAAIAPLLGVVMDRLGPRWINPIGAVLVSAGLILATFTSRPWHLYLTLGVLVTGGTVTFSYIGHSMFLPHWFVRRRGLAIGIAFSGVGAGSIILFPLIQSIIGGAGWRQACWMLAALLLAVVLPLNFLLQRQRPEDLGLRPDGEAPAAAEDGSAADGGEEVGTELGTEGGRTGDSRQEAEFQQWTLRRALGSSPFWWIAAAYFCALTAWYMVQVHQTKYLIEIGIGPETAAFALGLVGLTGIAGMIGLGYLSDRAGREWAWTIAGLGFAACYVILLLMQNQSSLLLMYLMVTAQGALGYGLASVYGAIPAEIFQGRSLAKIFGMLSLAAALGAGFGPWMAGAVQDATGSYVPAFLIALAASLASIFFIWAAAPSKGPVR